MDLVKIQVTGAVIDGHVHGEQLEVDRTSAEYLAGIGYAKILEEVKTEEPKKAAPKKAASKK